MAVGSVLGFWGRGLVRERGDWVAGLPLVLKRVRDGEPGLFHELAMVTARWRPWSSTGVEWVQRVAGAPRAVVEQQEVACGPPRWRAALALRRQQSEAERERGGR